MSSRYNAVHQSPAGPGDARPTGVQIIKDEGLEGKLSEKVFLITGASSGIGPETGRAFAATGAKVFMTVRDLKKGEAACAEFLEPGRVELIEMDQNSLASVRKAAKTFLSKTDKLNVLVCNAGIMAVPFAKTEDGFESQFGVCHLSHFLLFDLLKDTLLVSSSPDFHSRVVTVSSTGHQTAGIQPTGNYSFEDGSYNEWVAYGQAKTANIYMANEIEARYGTKGLHGISVHPGAVATNLFNHLDGDTKSTWMSNPQLGLILKTPAQGAANSVLAAVGKEYEGKGRIHLAECEPAKPAVPVEGDLPGMTPGYAGYAFDAEKEKRLWEDSLVLVGRA